MSAQTKKIKWVDLGVSGANARLRFAKFPDRTQTLVLLGITPNHKEWDDAKKILGFTVTQSGRGLVRSKLTFKISEFQQVFPNIKVVEIPEDEVYLRFDQKAENKQSADKKEEKRLSADLMAAIPLGLNYLGQQVFENATGRHIRAHDGEPIHESSAGLPGAFLRAESEDDLNMCADGFVLRMSKEMLRPADLRNFAGVIYGEKELEQSDPRLRVVQEAVEAAMNRYFAKNSTIADQESFLHAVKLVNHQPEFFARTSNSVENSQYSTALTISVAAQYLLGDVKGKRILEPTIGNGSLISLLRDSSEIVGVEIDPERAQRVMISDQGLPHATVLNGDFNRYVGDPSLGKFDCVIANPPFGGLNGKRIIQGLAVTRIDHLILVNSLSMRKDDGLSVYIIGADHEVTRGAEPGSIFGGSRNLFNWLCDHYETSAFEIDGDLYAKQGARYPVRMVVVGKKRPVLDKTHRIEKLPHVKTTDELWQKAVEVRAAFFPEEKLEQPKYGKEENDFQSQYIPCSRIGEASSMIPTNLVAAQAAAFEKLRESVPNGDVDQFVYNELKLGDIDGFDFAEMFTPEQVDAIALEILAVRSGRALILADKTGQGKGRICAAMARWAALNNQPAIFITEKPNLFSDFWRDIVAIKSDDLFKPAIINLGEKVVSMAGEEMETLLKPTPAKIQKQILSGDNPLDLGFNLVMATYSQFSKSGSEKAEWLKRAAEHGFMVLDESHNAAGDSATSSNITQAIDACHGVLYSSATFAKDAKNMRVYARAFPKTVNIDTLAETLAVGGEPLQEVLSSMLCEDGVYIRREGDLSHLTFEVVEPSTEILQRNIEISDRFAEALSAISFISGDLEGVIYRENMRLAAALEGLDQSQRQGNRVAVEHVSIFSRLYTVQRQLLLALNADAAVADCLKVIENGGKPVIGLEQTMESVLKEVMDASEMNDGVIQKITAQTLLHRLLDKVLEINYRNDYGVTEKSDIFEIIKNDSRDIVEIETKIANTKKAIEETRHLINLVPAISIMPIDVIKQKLEDRGLSVGEISGRTFETREKDGKLEVTQLKTTRAEVVFGFNNGDYDASVLTVAGATGLSLHAAKEFLDKRQRTLIETQIPNNVNVRVQMFGRVDRRGQVSSPIIKSVTCGLPVENRMLAMQNQKLRKLSANTQSNRNSTMEIDKVPDMLNWVGDRVCYDFFLENPDLVKRLGFRMDIEDKIDRGEENYYVSKLGRIGMLKYIEQVDLYRQLTERYNSKLEEMTNLGVNPFEARVLDVKAKIDERFALVDGRGTSSVFDRPVVAEKLVWQEESKPIRYEKLESMIAEGMDALLQRDSRITHRSMGGFFNSLLKKFGAVSFWGMNKDIRDAFDDLMLKSLPEKYQNPDYPERGVQKALRDSEDNIVKTIGKRKDWLLDEALRKLNFGVPISFSSDSGVISGIIANIEMPDQGEEHYLGRWRLKIVVPGESKVRELSLNQLYEDKEFKMGSPYEGQDEIYQINNAPAGIVTMERWTLTGNLFAAAEIAAQNKIGHAGLYTDEHGIRHRAIILMPRINRMLLETVSVPLNLEDAIENVKERLHLNPVSFTNGYKLEVNGDGNCVLTCPGAKSKGGTIYLDKEITDKLGQFSGDKKAMRCKFFPTSENIEFIVSKLYRVGCVTYDQDTPANKRKSISTEIAYTV